MGLHVVPEGAEPAFGHLHIGVEEEIVGSINLAQGLVVARRETVVLRQGQALHFGKFRLEHFEGTVGRTVVGHDNEPQVGRVADHGGQEAAHHVAAVPVEDDHGYLVSLYHGLVAIREEFGRGLRHRG